MPEHWLRNFLLCLLLIAPALMVQADSATITGNGSASDNQISSGTNSQTTVAQSNQATVSNQVSVGGDTGSNTANANNASGSIQTGDITSKIAADTTGNINQVQAPSGAGGDQNVKISGNGAGSQNNVNNETTQTTNITSTQQSQVTNNVNQNLNTGGNTASGILGNFSVTTGSITSEVNIGNVFNQNQTVITCPTCGPTPPPPPSGGGGGEQGGGGGGGQGGGGENGGGSSNNSSSGGTGGGSESSSSSNNPEVLGANTGEILPATGDNNILLLTGALIGAGLLGLSLRKYVLHLA